MEEREMGPVKDEFFTLAENYIRFTGTSVFLTGKAGTGKTTFLKYIAQNCPKRHVILAPTGVAAINAGGSTIHSFFRLPLCPYLPDVPEMVNEYSLPYSQRSLKKDRIKIIRSLELLVIDEISMVRADLLDAVDMVLRRVRLSSEPFGGVQLLMIGDVQQLSPVVTESEAPYLARVYPSPYFFESKALKSLRYVTVELRRIHRQTDGEFISILNAIRQKSISSELLARLNSRVLSGQCPIAPSSPARAGSSGGHDAEPIRLMTHVAQALAYNQKRLDALKGRAVRFIAELEGEFPESMYPTDAEVVLKEGAQVMFIRNDSEGEYYNGKLGTVTSIVSDDVVTVCGEDGREICVTAVTWENSKYSLDEESGEIKQEVAGKFAQIPLRTAWAITIHKSQGLTFDRVIIDASAAFSPGQVYVALSRCRSLDGIILEHPISRGTLFPDMSVDQFERSLPACEDVSALLPQEQIRYRFDCIRSVFDLSQAGKRLSILKKIWSESLYKLYPSEADSLREYLKKLIGAEDVAEKFFNQINGIRARALAGLQRGEQLATGIGPGQGETADWEEFLSERLARAVDWFLPVLDEVRAGVEKILASEIDNAEVRRKVRTAGEELMTVLGVHVALMEMVRDRGFTVEDYQKTASHSMLQDYKPSRKKVARASGSSSSEGVTGSVNEELREALQEWRSAEFKAENIPAYMIMHQSTLMEIATVVPHTREELIAVKGFSEKKFEKWGEAILAITEAFVREQ